MTVLLMHILPFNSDQLAEIITVVSCSTSAEASDDSLAPGGVLNPVKLSKRRIRKPQHALSETPAPSLHSTASLHACEPKAGPAASLKTKNKLLLSGVIQTSRPVGLRRRRVAQHITFFLIVEVSARRVPTRMRSAKLLHASVRRIPHNNIFC